jgi:hypothetical protein
MRQIAEFVAVLACGLFTGAAVYISLIEHPARMECGIEIAAAEFPPSYRRASVMQTTLAAVGLLSSIAAWLAGATFWWSLPDSCWFRHPIHADRDPANQQAVVEPDAGQAVSRGGSATRTLGCVACRQKPSQCFGPLPRRTVQRSNIGLMDWTPIYLEGALARAQGP